MAQATTVSPAPHLRTAAADERAAAAALSPDRPAAPPVTLGAQFGEMVWLLSQSPPHRHLFVSDLEWASMPPMPFGQHRIWRTPAQVPAGFAVWAFVLEDAERRPETGATPRLRPDEWRGGDCPWLVDLVAPKGGADEMLAGLRRIVFPGRGRARRGP